MNDIDAVFSDEFARLVVMMPLQYLLHRAVALDPLDRICGQRREDEWHIGSNGGSNSSMENVRRRPSEFNLRGVLEKLFVLR